MVNKFVELLVTADNNLLLHFCDGDFMRYGNRAIMLLDDRFFQNRLESELAANSVQPSKIPELVSLDAFRVKAIKEGNISFLREMIASMIADDGAPLIIAVNLRTTVFQRQNEDRSLLISMLLLSYMLLSRIRDYEDIHASLLIPFRNYEYDQVREMKADYRNYLNHPLFKNEKVADVTELFLKEKNRFDSLFTIDYVDTSTEQAAFEAKIKFYVKAIEKRRTDVVKVKAGSPAEVITIADARADVLYLSERGEFLLNGDVSIESVPADLPAAQITVRGKWGSSNLLDVNDKLIMTVGALLEKRIITYSSELFIYLRNDCVIDGSIASSAANLLVKMFGRFKGTYLCVTIANDAILARSPGYALIRSHIKRI